MDTSKIGCTLGEGFKVIRSSLLPPKTMYVSDDIYDLLMKGPEEVEKQHAELLAQFDHVNALVARAKERR